MSEASTSAIETVLCAFDFSETAERALQQAVRFARRHGAKIVLAHVVEPLLPDPYPALLLAENELNLRSWAARRLEQVADSLRDDRLVIETQVDEGKPGPHLIAISQTKGADLVVIGTRGLTGLKHLVIGSTAEYVVRRSRCPVLPVHPDDRVLAKSIETVILPTDLSSDATRAAEAFVSLFGHWERPRVIFAYADRMPPYLDPFRHETLLRVHERDVIKEKIERKMESVAELLRAADFEVETVVLDGDPVTVISELAEARKADLILLGTHGRSAVTNVLMGRTAQRIVQHAPCPVLTVRTQKPAVAQ